MKNIHIQDGHRTLIYRPLKLPRADGVSATLIGYIRAGRKFMYGFLLLLSLSLTGCVTGNEAVASTKIKGTLNGTPFEIVGGKDFSATRVEVDVATNRTVHVLITDLNSKNNPAALAAGYQGLSDLVDAGGRQFKAGTEAAGKAVGTAAKAFVAP